MKAIGILASLFLGICFSPGNALGEGPVEPGGFVKRILLAAWEKKANLVVSPFLVKSMCKVLGDCFGAGLRKQALDFFGFEEDSKDDYLVWDNRWSSIQGKDGVLALQWRYWAPAGVKPTQFFQEIASKLGMVRVPAMSGREGRGNLGNLSLSIVAPKFRIESVMNFKGTWVSRFERSKTKKGVFYSCGPQEFVADFMTGRKKCLFILGKGFKAVSLEIKGGYPILFVLPFRGVGLDLVLRNLSPLELGEEVCRKTESRKRISVNISIPKFRWKSGRLLEDLIHGNAKGPVSLRIPGKSVSDVFKFPKILLERKWVVEFQHSLRIMWREDGAEASAQMVASAGVIGGKAKPPKFLANRPFLFFVFRKKDRSLLFSGLVCSVGEVVGKPARLGMASLSEEDRVVSFIKNILKVKGRSERIRGREGDLETSEDALQAFLWGTKDLRVSILNWIDRKKRTEDVAKFNNVLLFAIGHGCSSEKKIVLKIARKHLSKDDYRLILSRIKDK